MIGIHEYAPGTRAQMRRPTRHGARGNGHAPGLIGVQPAGRRLIDQLAEQHRAIRQMLEDARRMGGS